MTIDQIDRAATALAAEERGERPVEAQERRGGGRHAQYTMSARSRGWQYGGRAPIAYDRCAECGATMAGGGCWRCRMRAEGRAR